MFSKPRYSLVAIFTAFFILTLAVWLRNFRFLATVIRSPLFPPVAKFRIFFAGFGALATNYSFASAFCIAHLAALTGIYIGILLFYYANRARAGKALGIGTLGTIFGFLGIGCSACGSLLISSLVGLGATAGFLSILPLQGLEFGIVSSALLVFSIYTLAKKIDEPVSCRVGRVKK